MSLWRRLNCRLGNHAGTIESNLIVLDGEYQMLTRIDCAHCPVEQLLDLRPMVEVREALGIPGWCDDVDTAEELSDG